MSTAARKSARCSLVLLPALLLGLLLLGGHQAWLSDPDSPGLAAELFDFAMAAWARRANPGSDPYSAPCLLAAQSGWLQMLLQPDTDCRHCANLTSLPELRPGGGDAISPARFRSEFLERNVPVVVRGGAADWPAVTGGLGLGLLRRLYREARRGRQTNEGHPEGAGGGASVLCQMFDYKNQFPTLGHFFRWSQEPDNLSRDSWYVGWNVCNQRVARRLRRLYKRPGFLTSDSEHGATEWIFAGGPGKGAPAHIDAVYYNTWQAQIHGSKWWRLRPPLNCYYTCQQVYEVLLKPGDIIALKTSKWIHETEVKPGEMSIALGAEFD